MNVKHKLEAIRTVVSRISHCKRDAKGCVIRGTALPNTAGAPVAVHLAHSTPGALYSYNYKKNDPQ